MIKVEHEYFQNVSFPSTVIEWNNLGNDIRNFKSVSAFKNQFLKFEEILGIRLISIIYVELNCLQGYTLG